MHGNEKELFTQQHLSPQLSHLLEFFSVQQKRIADAQEKKAAAEERKANALEKRAEAQKLMAEALNKIAEALYRQYRESKPGDIPDSAVNDILHPPADMSPVLQSLSESIPEDDIAGEEIPAPEAEEHSNDKAAAAMEVEDKDEEIETVETQVDSNDKVQAVQETETNNEEPEPLETELPVGDEEHETVLAVLPENNSNETSVENELSDTDGGNAEFDIDSLLDESPEPGEEKAGLSEDAAQELEEEFKIDAAAEEVDDETESSDKKTDTEEPNDPPVEAVSPETVQEPIPNDYKSKIVSRIITLKEKKGFSIDATVSYLNEKGLKPISSEGLWDRDMVSKIFSHINTVRTKRGD